MRLLFLAVSLLLCAADRGRQRRTALSVRGGGVNGGRLSGGRDDSESDGGGFVGSNPGRVLEIGGAAAARLDGVYTQTSWDVNGRSHYERAVKGDARGSKIHLYWSGSQWVLHFDLDPSRNFDNLLAYAKVRVADPRHTSTHWHVRKGQSYEASALQVHLPGVGGSSSSSSSSGGKVSSQAREEHQGEMFGVPRVLLPLYLSFLLDATAVGLAMPLLPFYVMELGANALQLSMVISCNYIAQSVGCVVMGRISDRHGRRPVLMLCLGASALSFFCVSRAKTLVQVALARVIVGAFGGLTPVMQSCVADASSPAERPKYLGRIMATFGIGFVLGPALSAAAPGFTTREKIRLSALLPLLGLLVSAVFFRETKQFGAATTISTPAAPTLASAARGKATSGHAASSIAVAQSPSKSASVSTPVLLLVTNGFFLMYAFATETIYAMFIKDSFGYGERVLSALLAFCGLFIGIFQTFFIKPLITRIGKHATLAVGNGLLAAGMVGVALVREEKAHFALFAAHIIGYSIADTALASLISRYSPASSQGRDLALNQAAQSVARVLSPLFAGLLYERSKRQGILPLGALPFLTAAVLPAVGIVIPSLLILQSRARKAKLQGAKRL